MTDPVAPAATLGDLSGRLADDLIKLDGELSEVDQLVTQAKSEATRHEARRVAAADKFEALTPDGDPKERLDQTASLVTLTKRAALMETQVDVLEGKRRALARYRDALVEYLAAMGGLDAGMVLPTGPSPADAGRTRPTAPTRPCRRPSRGSSWARRRTCAARSRGPCTTAPPRASRTSSSRPRSSSGSSRATRPRRAGEVRQLVAMVQHTLDATKSFIFDVRPMVLDDLGLVPTLRRATRERGQRAGIPVEFDSMGQDRRLPMDLESGLFRMLDEALAAYLGAAPDRVTLVLDWADQLEARVRRDASGRRAAAHRRTPTLPLRSPARSCRPPSRRCSRSGKRMSARPPRPPSASRSSSCPSRNGARSRGERRRSGSTAELLLDGSELRLVADIPAVEPPPEE